MEQNKMDNNILTQDQVYNLSTDLIKRLKIELIEKHPDINKFELQVFVDKVLYSRVTAILCTLRNSSYESIVKVVHDKLDLDDLFDNRNKYLN
jgi:hypothetical protein